MLIFFFVTSCGTFDDVKRGITGAKEKSTDEFFIEKKDPLVVPPDYENLPSPDERTAAIEEASAIEKTLGASIEEDTSESSSVEDSILKKIKLK